MGTHKAFATCASQYSWITVIENHSNAKEIYGADMEFKLERPYLVLINHVPNY